MLGKHYITIEHKTRQPDGQGGFIVEWQKYKSLWATVSPLNTKEIVQYQAINREISHNVFMRYDPTISTKHRINFNGRILEIKGRPINVDELNKEMKIDCLETFIPQS